ncbi:unnamed protein product [Owenia fusiformis]|uniref:Uncharacterized protein n=1 Tax=Owenia fusiformis TaxID=6347 RepID=A0A8J1TZC7_OWEFU|nr:unnamed protein product [Owenia fusiformis]
MKDKAKDYDDKEMAGVSAVRFDRANDNKMMPPIKTGTDFLASSHFQISQEPSVTGGAFKSIFKKDYVPHPFDGRPGATKPPAPADIMHKDSGHFFDKISETKLAYEAKHLNKPELRNQHNALSKTNFKMDSDRTKFCNFDTTHDLEFPPKVGPGFQKAGPKQNPMESFIPQGDIGKAPQPISDYRDRYRGHDANENKIVKAKSDHYEGPPTVKGDNRLHHFDTTHNDIYRGQWQPKLPALPAPIGSNIPQGDMDRENVKMTEQQDSYPARDLSKLDPYNKAATMGRLQRTNFRQDGGHNEWGTYQSEQKDQYRALGPNIDRNRPTQHRNHSDFPIGDYDPKRMTDQASLTTNRFYHGHIQQYGRPKIVSGANKRTSSNVWFGEPTHNDLYYQTTMNDKYTPKYKAPYKSHRDTDHSKSSIPLDYYGNLQNTPTTWSDFPDPNQGKLIPNPEAIDNLRRSHIQPPLGGDRHFSTEHVDQFTPKKTNLYQVTDAGKLQKSSVPIGTLNI